MAGKNLRQLVKNILGKRKNLMEQMIKVLANRKKNRSACLAACAPQKQFFKAY